MSAAKRSLSAMLRADPLLGRALESLRSGRPAELSGAPAGAWGLLAQHLARELDQPVLAVAADPHGLVDDLLAFDGGPRPLLYPAADVLPMDRTPPSDEFVAARLGTQAAVQAATAPVLVAASPAALMRPAPAPGLFREGARRLAVGEAPGLESLIAWLVEWGYVREGQVERPGEFAGRGGIVDVYPPAGIGPVRVEFMGDQVDSIRGFELTSQASVTRLDDVTLLPAREFPHRQADTEAALERLRGLDYSGCLPEVEADWRDNVARLAEAGYFPGVEALYPYLADAPATLLDYFQAPPLVLLVEADRVRTTAERTLRDTEELIASEVEHGELPRGVKSGLVRFADLARRFPLVLELEAAGAGPTALGWQPPTPAIGRIEALPADLAAASGRGATVLLATTQPDRMRTLLEAGALSAPELEELDLDATELPAGALRLIDAGLRSGFRLPSGDLTVYSDLEVFGVAPHPRRRPRATRTADASDVTAAFHLEIEQGQLVVHRDHGVGIFQGLRSIDDGGAEREYIAIEYAAATASSCPWSTWTESSCTWVGERSRRA